LTSNNEQIVGLLNQYEKESKAIKEELLKLCWFMRGGITYDEAFLLSSQEREIIGKIIEDNMETTKKSGLPFF
jgi:hypothetical protein